MLTPSEKFPLLEKKILSEEDRTHDTVSSRTASPTHYQLSYSGSQVTGLIRPVSDLRVSRALGGRLTSGSPRCAVSMETICCERRHINFTGFLILFSYWDNQSLLCCLVSESHRDSQSVVCCLVSKSYWDSQSLVCCFVLSPNYTGTASLCCVALSPNHTGSAILCCVVLSPIHTGTASFWCVDCLVSE